MMNKMLQSSLDALGWTAPTLARMLGCHRTLPQAWLSGRAAVPPQVQGWLLDLADFHARCRPPEWRTKSAEVEVEVPVQFVSPHEVGDEPPDPALIRPGMSYNALSEPAMNGPGNYGAFHLDHGPARYLDGSRTNQHGERVCKNPWARTIHHNGRHSFRSARRPWPDVYVEADGHIRELLGRYVDSDGILRRG